MSSSMDVHIATLPLGNFLGATELPLAKLPSVAGGITILEAYLVGPSAGTVITGQIVTLTETATGGTPAINGTVGAYAGTIVTAAGVVHKLTLSNAFVAGGYWIGHDQASGTVPAGSFVTIAYVMGKGTPS